MNELIAVCWLWKGSDRDYGPWHVHRLRDMFARNYSKPHRFLCITDTADGLECETLPMPLVLPETYRRLWLFSKQAAELIPGRIFQMDLDCVIVRNLDQYLDRSEPFVVMSDPMYHFGKYASSFLLNTGSRTDIWDAFDPAKSPKKMQVWFRKNLNCKSIGADQAWLSYYLHKRTVPTFVQHRARLIGDQLPSDAHIVHFPGQLKPWTQEAQDKYQWVRDYATV